MENNALVAGVVLRNFGSSARIVDCCFIKNNAGGGGGAIANGNGSVLEVSRCRFVGNTAEGAGAIACGDQGCTTIIERCVFSTDVANYIGGALLTNGGSPRVTNCSFAGNAAEEGGAIWNQYATPIVRNSIFYGNTASSSGSEVFNQLPSTPTFFCDISGSGGSGAWNSMYGIDGGGNIDANPLYSDPDGVDNLTGTIDDDLSLWWASPCRDAGDGDHAPFPDMNADLPHDDLNWQNTGIGSVAYTDIGAFESQFNSY